MNKLFPYIVIAILILGGAAALRFTSVADLGMQTKNAKIAELEWKLTQQDKEQQALKQELVLFQQENQYKELTQLDSQLQEYFSIVRENNGKRAWWKQVGLYDKQAELAADMAKAAAGNLVWKREEGQFSQKTNQNSYVLQADRADSLLAYGNVKGTEQEKLNAILRLLQNIRYEEDLNDQFRFPLETLNLGSGDCDDFSILSATLLERANIPTAIVLVSNEDGTLAHAWIAVQGEFDLPVADINLPGKWHLVEPQFTIAQQAQEWFDQYPRTLAVAEV